MYARAVYTRVTFASERKIIKKIRRDITRLGIYSSMCVNKNLRCCVLYSRFDYNNNDDNNSAVTKLKYTNSEHDILYCCTTCANHKNKKKNYDKKQSLRIFKRIKIIKGAYKPTLQRYHRSW